MTTASLIVLRLAVTATLLTCVGLAAIFEFAATQLAAAQKVLTDKIARAS